MVHGLVPGVAGSVGRRCWVFLKGIFMMFCELKKKQKNDCFFFRLVEFLKNLKISDFRYDRAHPAEIAKFMEIFDFDPNRESSFSSLRRS